MRLPRRTLLAAGLAPLVGAAIAGPRRLVVPLAAEPAGLIPGVHDDPATRMVGSKIYQGLCRLTPLPVPELADRWEASEDGRTWHFTLRDGVTWHDGRPLTAEDVAFSLDRVHRNLAGRIAAVEAADPRTAIVTLAEPDAAFPRLLDALSAPIVPRHLHDRSDLGLDPRAVPPVGSGPFRLAGWLRLVRFEAYAGPPPALDEIALPVLPDWPARLAVAQAGQPFLLAADAMNLAATPLLRRQAGAVLEGVDVPGHPMLAWLALNPDSRPLDNRLVRSGLSAAIDRAALLRDAWAGLGRVARVPPAALPDYDPRAASGQFDAAGLRPDDAGIRATIRHLVRPGAPWQRLAEQLARMLGQVGIMLVTEPVDAAEWSRRVAALQYETTAMVGERAPPAEDMAQLWLVEPALPVLRDRRLQLPSGPYGSFADAVLV